MLDAENGHTKAVLSNHIIHLTSEIESLRIELSEAKVEKRHLQMERESSLAEVGRLNAKLSEKKEKIQTLKATNESERQALRDELTVRLNNQLADVENQMSSEIEKLKSLFELSQDEVKRQALDIQTGQLLMGSLQSENEELRLRLTEELEKGLAREALLSSLRARLDEFKIPLPDQLSKRNHSPQLLSTFRPLVYLHYLLLIS